MNEQTPPDLFAISREMMAQWEQSVNAMLTQHMSTSDFSKQVHESMTSSAQAAKALSKMSAPLNYATKSDVAEIGQRLQTLEEQLARVESLLQQLLPEPASPARPTISRAKRFPNTDPSKP